MAAVPIIEKAWWKTQSRSTPEDSVVIALHGLLLSKGYNLVSLTDEGFSSNVLVEQPLSTLANPSLPDGWNKDCVYTMVYKHTTTNKTILLKGLKMDENLLILNMAVANSDEFANVTISILDYVDVDNQDTMSGTFKDLSKMLTLFDKELISKVTSKPNSKISPTKSEKAPTKANRQPDPVRPPPSVDPLRDHDPLRIGPPRQPLGMGPYGGIGGVPLGQGDLDPFSGGGGMIFDPLRMGGQSRQRFGDHRGPGVPPGVPPGARYDPYGPLPGGPRPGGGRYPPPGGGPNPDHLPPPGMGGNYYI